MHNAPLPKALTPMNCPDLETLCALADGKRLPEVESHLKDCPSCLEEVGALRSRNPAPQASREALTRLKASTPDGSRPHRWAHPALALAAAAALLLAAGVFWVNGHTPSDGTGGSPPALQSSRPGWLTTPGIRDRGHGEESLLLGGSVPAIAGKGARIEVGPGRVTLVSGSLTLEIPGGLPWTVASPGGASARAEGTALWAEQEAAPETAAGWIRDAFAEASETPEFRVWAGSGTLVLKSPDGSTSTHAAPALAIWDGSTWACRPSPEIPHAVRDLGLAWTAPARPWTAVGASVREQGGWKLGPGSGRVLFPDAPPEGVLRVRVLPVAPDTELALAFPHPDGARLWRIGDWGSRKLGRIAVLSVAYGPWGAAGYVDGELRWHMDAAEAARALARAPEGLEAGLASTGGPVSVLEDGLLLHSDMERKKGQKGP